VLKIILDWEEDWNSIYSAVLHLPAMSAKHDFAQLEALTAKVAELEACLERQGSGHREDLDEIANISVERLRRAEKAEAERDRLREALNQSRLAFAGHVSVQSAIDLIDRAALKDKSHD
jgi:hypothetical protein